MPRVIASCRGCEEGGTPFESRRKENPPQKEKIAHNTEQRISQHTRWHDDNAETITFGQFYRENYPKQYREWHTGQWERDIAFRDSLRRDLSHDRLKRLYEIGE